MEFQKNRHSRVAPTLKALQTHGYKLPTRTDAGFAGNDKLKANAVQLFKAKGMVLRTV
ncbi:MAG: hypothetical protein JST45_09385 [Bacteroidetes bacterium]|nr:hypothetical protein [Bacteroidota bacterium]